jgi:hypothetical protein
MWEKGLARTRRGLEGIREKRKNALERKLRREKSVETGRK